jgi:hypothetical protein
MMRSLYILFSSQCIVRMKKCMRIGYVMHVAGVGSMKIAGCNWTDSAEIRNAEFHFRNFVIRTCPVKAEQ